MTAPSVYAAEDQWSAALDRGGTVDFFGSRLHLPAQRRFGDVESVDRYVDAVLSLPAVVAGFPSAGPARVRERAGQRRAHYEPSTGTIAVPMRTAWAARESVVLHEIAHHLACSLVAPAPEVGAPELTGGKRRDWHGAQFRQTMCGLVEAVLGVEAALLLRAGYEAAGLRTVSA